MFVMSYSDLLARQEKELERLNQEYYADHVTIKKLQDEHYDKTRYDGQLERLKEAHERKVKDAQSRFATEQKAYLNEPDAPTVETLNAKAKPDISESQDKMAATLEQRQQQRTTAETKPHHEPHSGKDQTAPVKDKDMTDEVQRLMKQSQERRAQQKQHRRGYRR